MADRVEEEKEQINLMGSLPFQEPGDRIDALWRQIMVYKAFAEGDLSESRSRRAQAETAREKAEAKIPSLSGR